MGYCIPEFIDFDGKKWVVKGKAHESQIDDHTKLKEMYGCDLVLKNKEGMYFMLNQVIDAEFEELNDEEE